MSKTNNSTLTEKTETTLDSDNKAATVRAKDAMLGVAESIKRLEDLINE